MPITNVHARWNNGALEFYDRATGNTLLGLDDTSGAVTLSALTFSTANALTPTGTTAASATQALSSGLTVLSGASAANLGVALPAAAANLVIGPVLATGTTTLVYPVQNGTTINGGSANGSLSMAANTGKMFIGISASQWQTFP